MSGYRHAIEQRERSASLAWAREQAAKRAEQAAHAVRKAAKRQALAPAYEALSAAITEAFVSDAYTTEFQQAMSQAIAALDAIVEATI